MDGEGMNAVTRKSYAQSLPFYSLAKRSAEVYPNMLPNGQQAAAQNAKPCILSGLLPDRFRTRPFPQWKPMECWSCRFVRQTTLTIIMVLERLRIPAVIY